MQITLFRNVVLWSLYGNWWGELASHLKLLLFYTKNIWKLISISHNFLSCLLVKILREGERLESNYMLGMRWLCCSRCGAPEQYVYVSWLVLGRNLEWQAHSVKVCWGNSITLKRQSIPNDWDKPFQQACLKTWKSLAIFMYVLKPFCSWPLWISPVHLACNFRVFKFIAYWINYCWLWS